MTKTATRISKRKTYPAYKDSGIEWLGDVPEHWEIIPLRWYLRIESGSFLSNTEFEAEPTDVFDIPVIGGNGVMGFTDKANINRTTIAVGRVGAYCGNIHLVKTSAWITDNALMLSNVRSCMLEYLCSLLRVLNLNRLANQNTQPLITGTMVKEQSAPLPPLDEQRAIVRFLDEQTSKIDDLIKAKRELLALLKEKRQALISHAVTKGLNPNAKMKPSGIEWLGDVPEHWETQKLKYISKVKFSNVDKHTVDGEKSVHLCNYVDVYYNDYIRDDFDFMKATATQAEIDKFTVKSGDVIITKDSEAWDDIAVPAFVPDDLPNVLCGYHLAQIRPIPQLMTGEYLFRAFCSRGINDQFCVASNGVTRFGLGKPGLDNGMFAVPPLDEQRAIARFLDEQTSKIDDIAQEAEAAIERLTEYRTALISAAVTGKIDVRGGVA